MRKEISADPKYESEGRDAACSVRFVYCYRMLRAASECVASVVLQTQHSASLLACMFNPNRSLAHNFLMTDLFLIHYLHKIVIY